jgi:cholesterol transport system auxiliary component
MMAGQPTGINLYRWWGAVLAATLAVSGCSLLKPTSTPTASFYSLDRGAATPPAKSPASPSSQPGADLTLIISPPSAAAGFDSSRIIYVRQAHKMEYFAQSEWVDPPARMLGPLMASALEKTGVFRAVVLTPGSASGNLRLDTEITRLQQDFRTHPSRVNFVLRAYLVDDKTRDVVAWREFDESLEAGSEDARGGVEAANRVVQKVLEELSVFLTQRVAERKLGAPK